MALRLHTDTALARGVRELFKRLETRLSLRQPLDVFLAGGVAARALHALGAYVGNPNSLQLNLQEALALARRLAPGQ